MVNEVAQALNLANVTTIRDRAENVSGEFDFVVSRAVTALPAFMGWVKDKISPTQQNEIPNGVIYLKGGDFAEELKIIKHTYRIHDISQFFDEEFFETKKIVHLYPSSKKSRF